MRVITIRPYCNVMVKKSINHKTSILATYENHQKHENGEMEKGEKCKTCVKILRLTPPMTISALKPGPVVPPGIEKVPDQAARKTQSVDFGHLSDILAFFRGGRFLSLFLITFSLFVFCHF